MTACEALALEYKALACLRQGMQFPATHETAKRFARRAAKLLHAQKFYEEASGIAKKLLDSNPK